MHESIYHVYANYCGERRLLFAGYASRVARRLGMHPMQLPTHADNGSVSVQLAPTCDRYGNRMPYQLWTGLVTIHRQPNPEMEIAE